MTSPKPKIFIYTTADWAPDIACLALAEDGTGLTGHVSSSLIWARRDMGLDQSFPAESKHRVYQAHYPDGYELIDLIEASEETMRANEAFTHALDEHAKKYGRPGSQDGQSYED